MNKKNGFTLSEHSELGEILKAMSEDLSNAHTAVGNAYPRKGKALTALLNIVKAENALSAARSALDDLLCSELPKESDAWKGVYYGSAKERDFMKESEQ